MRWYWYFCRSLQSWKSKRKGTVPSTILIAEMLLSTRLDDGDFSPCKPLVLDEDSNVNARSSILDVSIIIYLLSCKWSWEEIYPILDNQCDIGIPERCALPTVYENGVYVLPYVLTIVTKNQEACVASPLHDFTCSEKC